MQTTLWMRESRVQQHCAMAQERSSAPQALGGRHPTGRGVRIRQAAPRRCAHEDGLPCGSGSADSRYPLERFRPSPHPDFPPTSGALPVSAGGAPYPSSTGASSKERRRCFYFVRICRHGTATFVLASCCQRLRYNATSIASALPLCPHRPHVPTDPRFDRMPACKLTRPKHRHCLILEGLENQFIAWIPAGSPWRDNSCTAFSHVNG
jgi:hypothetical protein